MLGAPAAEAGPWHGHGYGPRAGYGYHGGYRHYGARRGRNVAGAVAAGAALGIIGGAIIASQAQQARREREAAAAYYGY